MSNISPIGRISFPHLFKPQQNDRGENTWSVVIVFDKKAQATEEYKAMEAAIQNTATERFGTKVPAGVKRKSLEPKSGYPITATETKPEWFGWASEGSTMITFSSKYNPAVIDRNRQEILDASDVYAGQYGRVQWTTYAYDASGNQGVSFGLRAYQKVKDGDALSGGKPDLNSFGDLSDDDGDAF
jgi:hypothetical protein